MRWTTAKCCSRSYANRAKSASSADHAEHAAREAVLGAMAEVLAAAVGRRVQAVHSPTTVIAERLEAGIEQAAPVSLPQIEVDLRAEIGVAGRARRKKQHRIFLPNRVRVVDLREELRRVSKLALKLVPHLLADGEAARAQWPDRSRQSGPAGGSRTRAASVPTPRSTIRASVPRQPAWKAATARVRVSAISTGTQSAVRMPSRRLGSRGKQAIAAQQCLALGGRQREGGTVHTPDHPGMALADSDEVGQAGVFAAFGNGGDQPSPGFGDGCRIVLGSVAQVLLRRPATGVSSGLASLPRAETGQKPGIGLPFRDGDDTGGAAASGGESRELPRRPGRSSWSGGLR